MGKAESNDASFWIWIRWMKSGLRATELQETIYRRSFIAKTAVWNVDHFGRRSEGNADHLFNVLWRRSSLLPVGFLVRRCPVPVRRVVVLYYESSNLVYHSRQLRGRPIFTDAFIIPSRYSRTIQEPNTTDTIPITTLQPKTTFVPIDILARTLQIPTWNADQTTGMSRVARAR